MVYWFELRYGVGSVMVGGVTRLSGRTVYCGLFRTIDFSFCFLYYVCESNNFPVCSYVYFFVLNVVRS